MQNRVIYNNMRTATVAKCMRWLAYSSDVAMAFKNLYFMNFVTHFIG